MLEKADLEELYLKQNLSMMEIAHKLGVSHHKVAYWMYEHNIERRTISEAVYRRCNPNGDPFKLKVAETLEDVKLLGIGIGLYWGEGTKASKHAVRLGNTDPELIKTFMEFLIRLFGVHKDDLRFGLQIFTDVDQKEAMAYWIDKLEVNRSQFYKIHVTISGSIGTYRKKSIYGVVTVYYHNKKLRDMLVNMLPR